MSLNSYEKLEIVVKAADERLAQEIMALDVSQLSPLADYFVIMHARNERQLGAIVDGIVEKCAKQGVPVKNTEGKDGGKWVLIDIYDIVVHVFYYSERTHYNLEKVWIDAPTVDVSKWLTEQ